MKYFIIALLCFLCSALASPAEEYQTVDTVWSKKLGFVGQVRFSPDGKYLYASLRKGKPVKLDALTGELLQSYDSLIFFENFGPAPALDLSQSGDLLAAGTSPNYCIYNANTGEVIRNIRVDNHQLCDSTTGINSLSFSPNGQNLAYVLSGNYGDQGEFLNNVFIRNLQTDSVSFVFGNRNSKNLKFSPTRNILAIAGDHGELDIFDLDSNIWIFSNKFPELEIKDLSFSPDGSLLSLAFYTGSIKIIDMNTLMVKIDIPKAHSIMFNGNLRLITFVNNTTLISCGSDLDSSFNPFCNIVKWDLLTKEKLYNYQFIGTNDMIYDGNNDHVAIGSDPYLIVMKNQIRTGIEREEVNYDDILLSPNPVKNKANISFTKKSKDQTLIEILDLNSNIVDSVNISAYNIGRNQLEYEPRQLPSGTYFFRLKIGTTTRTIKFQIAR